MSFAPCDARSGLITPKAVSVQAPIILMSQNRQSEKDPVHAEHGYEVNLKAELEPQLKPLGFIIFEASATC